MIGILRLGRAAMMIAGALFSVSAMARDATPAADLDQVIARYIAWRGGPAFLKLATLHETGDVAAAGLTGTSDGWSDAEGRFRQVIDLGAVKQIQAGDRMEGWSLTTGGQIESRPKPQAIDAWRETLIEFAGVLTGGHGARVALMPDESDGGRSWRVVRVTFGDDDHYDLFIDGESGRLNSYRAWQDGHGHVVRLSDWRLVEGVRIAWSQHQTAEIAANNADIHIHTVTLNATPPPDWLARPADTHLVTFHDGERTSWMPFEFFGKTRIFIPAEINGVKTHVMLDTGAGTSVIDRNFAAALNIGGHGMLAARGAGGAASAQVANGVTIKLGSLELSNLTIAVLPLAPMEPLMGHTLPVILGKEVLAETVAEIDFSQHRIAFFRADTFVQPHHTRIIPLQIVEGGLRALEISVEHGRPILAQFDLGNGSPLLLYPSYWTAHDLKHGRPGTQFLDGGVGGMAPEAEISVSHLSIGEYNFRDVPTGLADTGVEALESTRVQANVGLPVFSRFRLAIDFPHDRLIVQADPNLIERPFDKDRAGLQIETGGIVRFVAPGSPAEAQGWQIGDRIVLVDGKELTAGNLAWRLGDPGTHVVLDGLDQAGNAFHRSLELATFY